VTAVAERAASEIAEALAARKVNPFVEAVDETAAALRRWAVIDQLVTTPIPWSPPAEVDDIVQLCDDWAEILVQAAAFAHVRGSPGCRGYTTWSSGRAGCGLCRWGMSARTSDAGAAGSARFAQAALARYGQAIALAVGEVVQVLFEAVLPC
jgi:hypothetical protein